MRGAPLTRVSSANGRWAYTLYDGAGTTPFLHALDTSSRSARCVDLDMLAGADLSGVRLRLDGVAGTLTVTDKRQPVAVVSMRTFRARAPVSGPGASAPGTRDGATIPWTLLWGSSVTALAVVGALVIRRRGGAGAQPRRRRNSGSSSASTSKSSS